MAGSGTVAGATAPVHDPGSALLVAAYSLAGEKLKVSTGDELIVARSYASKLLSNEGPSEGTSKLPNQYTISSDGSL